MSTAGRGAQKNTSNQAAGNVGAAQGLENQGQNIASSEINTSGGLSPLVGKQLANEQGQIGKAYTTATQGAERGLSQRGMGVAPSGLQSSLQNTAINNAGQAKTGAIGNAFGEQNTLNNSALSQPISALNAGTGAVNAATGANTALSQMPTMAGQVFSGLQGLGQSAGSVMSGIGAMCWIAAAVFGEDLFGPKTCAVREYLMNWARSSFVGKIVVFAYSKIGRQAAKSRFIVNLLRPTFEKILAKTR